MGGGLIRAVNGILLSKGEAEMKRIWLATIFFLFGSLSLILFPLFFLSFLFLLFLLLFSSPVFFFRPAREGYILPGHSSYLDKI